MTAAKSLDFVSATEFLAGEQVSDTKHEYVGGYVYARDGAKTVHNRIAGAWLAVLFNALRGQPCEPFNSDMKVRVQLPTHTRFYYPDGMVVCEANAPDDLFQDRPVIVAKVLSDATRRIDEGEKREAYLTIPTLAAYLLIETDMPRVVVHRRTDKGFVAECYDGLEAVVPLPGIDVELPLAELYERVEFHAT